MIVLSKLKIKYKALYEKDKIFTIVFTALFTCVVLMVLLESIEFVTYHFLVPVNSKIDEEGMVFFENTWEVYIQFISLFTTVGRSISKLLIDQFPVLEDLKIDLNWLLIDFTRIIRTIFNLGQFLLIFIITRKIRRKIRKKFSKNETDWSAIKCF